MVKRLNLSQPNDSFAQSKEYICIIFNFMGLIRLINLAMLIQSIQMNEVIYEVIVNFYLLYFFLIRDINKIYCLKKTS